MVWSLTRPSIWPALSRTSRMERTAVPRLAMMELPFTCKSLISTTASPGANRTPVAVAMLDRGLRLGPASFGAGEHRRIKVDCRQQIGSPSLGRKRRQQTVDRDLRRGLGSPDGIAKATPARAAGDGARQGSRTGRAQQCRVVSGGKEGQRGGGFSAQGADHGSAFQEDGQIAHPTVGPLDATHDAAGQEGKRDLRHNDVWAVPHSGRAASEQPLSRSRADIRPYPFDGLRPERCHAGFSPPFFALQSLLPPTCMVRRRCVCPNPSRPACSRQRCGRRQPRSNRQVSRRAV